MKIIVLNSLSHSGSTVISMVLSTAENAISLGEVYQILRDTPDDWLDRNEQCSCSNALASCEFWKPVLEHIKSNHIEDIVEKYRYVIQFFTKKYGENSVLIDTSKGTKHFDIYRELEIEYKLIYLLRDVRSFAFSQSKVASRQVRKGIKKIKGKVWFQYLKWYFGNKKRLSKFSKENIEYHKVGYEDFCFNQEARLMQICEHTGVEYKKEYLTLLETKHHILMGNPMKNDKSKQTGIRYDSSWLTDKRNIVPSFFLSFILSYNTKHVYQHKS